MGDRICVMKEGHIMQVADPVTLYDKPANLFVAGFIGMPEMNLVPAELHRSDAGPVLRFGDQAVRLGPEMTRRLDPATGRDVTFGIRPQHLRLAREGEADALTAQVTKADFLGHEVDAHVAIGGHRFTVVLPVEAFRIASEGGTIRVLPEEGRAHVFDTATGRNVSLA